MERSYKLTNFWKNFRWVVTMEHYIGWADIWKLSLLNEVSQVKRIQEWFWLDDICDFKKQLKKLREDSLYYIIHLYLKDFHSNIKEYKDYESATRWSFTINQIHRFRELELWESKLCWRSKERISIWCWMINMDHSRNQTRYKPCYESNDSEK